MILYSVCATMLYKNKCHWENFINIFFIFLSKWVTIQFNFKFSKIKQDFFFKWDYLFQKNSYLDKILTKSAGLFVLLTN